MTKKIKLNISGMSCTNCSNAITKAALKLDGVKNATVSFTNSLGEFEVNEDFKEELLKDKIEKLGFSVVDDFDALEEEKKKHLKKMKIQIAFSGLASLLLMYLEMYVKPSFGINLFMLLLSTATIIYCAKDFILHAFGSLKVRNYDMNVLVTLGIFSAYFYSLIVFLFPKIIPKGLGHIYFSSSAMIICFILLGKFLEEKSKQKANSLLKDLIDISPKIALVKKGKEKIETLVQNLNIGDIVLVDAGSLLPCDGKIISGEANIDTSNLNGESLPAYKKVGDEVYASSINIDGYLEVEVSKKYNESLIYSITQIVSQAGIKKIKIARFADRISNIFVPVVVFIAILTFIAWFIFADFSTATLCAISVLLISCPCALGLATPISIVSGISKATKEGILIKNPDILENANKIKYAFFDKTKTLTKGILKVAHSTLAYEDMKKVCEISKLSSHPISKAIVEYFPEAQDFKGEFKNILGKGLEGKDKDGHFFIGNERLLNENGIFLKPEESKLILENQELGMNAILVGKNADFIGAIFLNDIIKENSKDLLDKLKSLGIKTVMLTGDHKVIAKNIAQKLEMDEFYSDLLPNDKFEIVKEHQKEGKVMFVGDGVNDSPSLKQADISISFFDGSDIAKEAVDAVLMKEDMMLIYRVLRISKLTFLNIKENLFWAFIYNIIFIPIAAGALYPKFAILLNPMYASIAMSLSSITVVLNALRLKFIKG